MRDRVKSKAPWFVYNFQELIDALSQASARVQQQQKSEVCATETNSTFHVSDGEALCSNSNHLEEIVVNAS